jgi:hypothetical protein
MTETTLLTDPKHTRGDLRQVETAIRKGWQIPDQLFEKAAIVAQTILVKGSNREKVAALRVLLAMNEQNNPTPQAKKPKQGMTVNVGVAVNGNTDDRRTRTLAIAERIRAERVS